MSLRRTTALVAALALLAVPAAAQADGDPASDVLLTEDVYLPYFPPPSKALAGQLTRLLAATRRNGYRMKVALIASPGDLGAYPELFNQPQRYANLLEQEIVFAVHQPHLLVVMPGGFGGENLGAGANVVNSITVDLSAKSDGLARAAIQAVAAVAKANGHPTPIPKGPQTTSSRGGAGSSHTWLYAGAAAFALLGVALALLDGRRRRRRAATS